MSLAGIMHKLSTAVPQSSTLTALCFLGLLGVLHEYACGALGVPAWRVTRLVILAPAALRHENLCRIPASGRDFSQRLRQLARTSHTRLYCSGAMIRPDCATHKWVPPTRKRVPPSRALSVRPFRRFATTWCEKCGLSESDSPFDGRTHAALIGDTKSCDFEGGPMIRRSP